MKDLAVGDRVHVARIGTGVIREVRNGRRYLVEIKGRTLVTAGNQLERAAPEPAKGKKNRREGSPRPIVATGSKRAVGASRSLDLHGKTVAESIDLVDDFLNDAILDGVTEVMIIHGRSGGRIKVTVHKRLLEMTAVRAFRLDPENPGATIVTL
jgi:DNA mismatch repair protein MutS2